MNEISIFEAWKLWLTDHLPSDVIIWGVNVFWWGRLGKMMQFVGAITIIADIIGPEKIRSFGASLHTAITRANLIRFLEDCFEWYTVIFRYTLMKDYTDEAPSKKTARYTRLDAINYVICFLITVLIIVLAKLYSTGWIVLIEAAIIFGCLLVSISPLITVFVIVFLIGFELVINFFFIKPLAWTLEHPSFERFTKVISLLLLLIGFHFELLAS